MTTEAITPLRQRMIEDMISRKLGAHSQRSHIYSCKRFAAFLKRSPGVRHARTSACSGCTWLNGHEHLQPQPHHDRGAFLVSRDAAQARPCRRDYHIREPQKIPQVMSPDEMRRLLAFASSLKVRVLLSLGYGCGLRAGEIVRLKVKHIDSAQSIIRIEQSKGRKGRERYQVMTLATHEFRRFLMHVLPAGFHRIRYYGLLASGNRVPNIARARELLTLPILPIDGQNGHSHPDQPQTPEHRCSCCGGRMIIIERFERGSTPRYRPGPPTPVIRIDTS